jgi:DNA polymerase III subunit epsilon
VLIAGLDFEATGINPQEDRVIEVGAVLFDWDTKQPIRMVSELVLSDVSITEEITQITGITESDLHRFGVTEDCAMTRLYEAIDRADYVMAHFGTEFDRPLYQSWAKRIDWPERPEPWLDSAIDIVYPARIKTRNLRHLAAEHGFLNPFSHRAVFDVLTMLQIASQYDLEAIIKRAAEPIIYFEAVVKYEHKDKAKERGYRWHAPTKKWWKSMKQSDFYRESEECGFPLLTLSYNPGKAGL